MELTEAMRTTFACREFTDEPVSDEVLHRILDVARFAPSGGNRQGGHVVVVRDPAVRRRLGELVQPTLRVYAAQAAAGETPFNSVHPTAIDVEAALRTPTDILPMFDHLDEVPVVLVVTVDLAKVASVDKDLDRVGLDTGASIYPLVWNILLAARAEGLGGVLTTLIVPAETDVQALLGLPDSHAIAALIPLGRPVKQLTRLRRRPVEEFVTVDHFDGMPLGSRRE
ncbi:MAG: nitroreductase family protein [Acidimicrobiales bacterium]|jgi:nitroreductase|nr:nitroreductase family protein [Actinomycetes bacterium]MDP6104864.1 nitroreductase family protein [Acidimicrobiales bacterium]MDP6160201.1 nitroreductase family protein [Acidimicrobiales bacterium]MDP6241469.1 nitroreductase family protein [Acidimicrobiales bacterium]MDP7125256.1 nitroreductase family protein [Acidimicrobiales bacterium]|tara:strand:+ start:24627 stop:25304 length:678 start_codon:yes stop_codon:yes gene_type:complete